MTNSKTRLQSVMNFINLAEQQANRPQGSVQLLAVSKTWPASRLRELAEVGQTRFGENYLQEALEKIDALADLPLEWHFIGPVQSNKTREIADKFDWVESIDRVKIAQRLSAQRPVDKAPLNICLQVNIDDESSKAGVHPDNLMELAAAVSQLENLRLRGLMVIPAIAETTEQQLDAFGRAQQLFSQLKTVHPEVDTLSMGMSADMQAAIAQGSTQVRIGTALFGERHTPNKK
ncbi:YggS family pyridoxal phosphate-dependent enzyme [Methylophaga pinxianii]|uniref:YggS family pyridoxal phosphate-dependent enzyme n=1 Tax=Methylophaga pinxianii TaxID=2881052 RepID=UPI001CF48BB8|nr:YggS family pyridoxal phosphate-dependent enzyme [Methylophaga pinxianii]MCB2425787.1 YggS family pyridoxal phosphate-dependent enzyme [Methylophaga pinxianii]UPH46369.1 YggS family pyridoxal phosphate-dependent enzyme [Methylophaga pinxianii]